MDSNMSSQADEVVRLTSDGFNLSPDYSLMLTLFTGEYIGWDGTVFCLSIDWQQEGDKRRPYLSINIGPFHIQTGWLWASPKEVNRG